MSVTIYKIEYALKSGKTLELEYTEKHWPGTYNDPPEWDTSEAEIRLDGKLVTLDELPKGLEAIVEDMYENKGESFNCKVTEREPARGYED